MLGGHARPSQSVEDRKGPLRDTKARQHGDGRSTVPFLGECTFPNLVEIRENPEVHDLMRMDKGHWPRCLLWHGWLPMLSGVYGASPWAADAAESAGHLLEIALGSYSAGLVSEWSIPEGFDVVETASQMHCWRTRGW